MIFQVQKGASIVTNHNNIFISFEFDWVARSNLLTLSTLSVTTLLSYCLSSLTYRMVELSIKIKIHHIDIFKIDMTCITGSVYLDWFFRKCLSWFSR